MRKWKYPDPKLKSEKEAWYDNVPDDSYLEEYIRALLDRHCVRNGPFVYDAALTGLLVKLFYKYHEKLAKKGEK